jgi:CheY-like chemotaxis protein
MSVLLHIDNDKEFRSSFSRVLERAGKTVISCRDINEARRKLKEGCHIDAAATDNIPSTFARELARTVPVIQVSGSPASNDDASIGFALQARINKLDPEWPKLVLESVSDDRLRRYRIDVLYTQIAELNGARDTPDWNEDALKSLIDELRTLQRQEADWIGEVYDANRILPPNAGRLAIQEADAILEKYEQPASPDETT